MIMMMMLLNALSLSPLAPGIHDSHDTAGNWAANKIQSLEAIQPGFLLLRTGLASVSVPTVRGAKPDVPGALRCVILYRAGVCGWTGCGFCLTISGA